MERRRAIFSCHEHCCVTVQFVGRGCVNNNSRNTRSMAMDFAKSFSVFNSVPAFASKSLSTCTSSH
jgi:hypothetical protein